MPTGVQWTLGQELRPHGDSVGCMWPCGDPEGELRDVISMGEDLWRSYAAGQSLSHTGPQLGTLHGDEQRSLDTTKRPPSLQTHGDQALKKAMSG